MSGKMDLYRSRLEHFQTKFAYLSPENRLREQRQRLADLENAVQNGMNRNFRMRDTDCLFIWNVLRDFPL